MKKILVVLLILAVAGGVFAQGSWSIGAGAVIGTIIDFANQNADEEGEAAIRGSSWFVPYGNWDGIKGTADLNYSDGPFSAGIEFSSVVEIWGPAPISMNVNYWGENYGFRAKSNFKQLFDGGQVTNELFGYYSFLNGMFNLEASYRRPNGSRWSSDRSIGDHLAHFGADNAPSIGLGKNIRNLNNWIIGELALSGLKMGLMFPKVFSYVSDEDATTESDYAWGQAGYPWSSEHYSKSYRFVDDVMKQFLFGLTFDLHPIDFAINFRLQDFETYFGLTWKILDGLSAGFSFLGAFPADEDDDGNAQYMSGRIGGQVNYSAGVFGVGVKGFYQMADGATKEAADKADEKYGGLFAIMPYFWYNVIPSHMAIKVDAGFSFNGWGELGWMVSPQLFWNFKGEGASTSYWGIGTGILIRYVLRTYTYCGYQGDYAADDSVNYGKRADAVGARNMNNLDITFKWSM